MFSRTIARQSAPLLRQAVPKPPQLFRGRFIHQPSTRKPQPPHRAVRSKRPPPPKTEYTPPPPEAEAKEPGMSIIYAFVALSVPITLIGAFPTNSLPGVDDPPHLGPYSKQPLTAGFWLRHPSISASLFTFRLRRGEYRVAWYANFTFTPLNYINDFAPTAWWTWTTHMFAHGSVFHWVGCFFGLQGLAPQLSSMYGTGRTAAFLLLSGTIAAAAECMWVDYRYGEKVRRMLGPINARARELRESAKEGTISVREAMNRIAAVVIKQSDPMESLEPEARRAVFSKHLGSSGALMAGLVVTAITMPGTRWTLMFIPVGIPVRVMMGLLVGWDVSGVVWNWGMNISHTGHLWGDAMGLVLYAVWLRRVPMPWKRVSGGPGRV